VSGEDFATGWLIATSLSFIIFHLNQNKGTIKVITDK